MNQRVKRATTKRGRNKNKNKRNEDALHEHRRIQAPKPNEKGRVEQRVRREHEITSREGRARVLELAGIAADTTITSTL